MDGSDEVSSTNDVLNNNLNETHVDANPSGDNGTCDSSTHDVNGLRNPSTRFLFNVSNIDLYAADENSPSIDRQLHLRNNMRLMDMVRQRIYYGAEEVQPSVRRNYINPERENELAARLINTVSNVDLYDDYVFEEVGSRSRAVDILPSASIDVAHSERVNEPAVNVSNESMFDEFERHRGSVEVLPPKSHDMHPERVNEPEVNASKHGSVEVLPSKSNDVTHPEMVNEPAVNVSKPGSVEVLPPKSNDVTHPEKGNEEPAVNVSKHGSVEVLPPKSNDVTHPEKGNEEPAVNVSKDGKNPKRDASKKCLARNEDGKPRKRHRKKSHRPKKHRTGRYHKRKWKPFIKMNAIERRKLEERDARRAQRTRDEMTRYGLSLAPYNTTQFLMEDHKIQTPNYSVSESSDHHKEGGNSTDSSDSYYEYPDDDEYISQNFSEEFQSAFYDLVGEWSHEQLVERYLELENMIDEQNKTLKSTQEQDESKIQVYRVELEKLGEVNRALIEENESLEIRLKLKNEV